MSRLIAYLGRFAVILLGFACAALAASAFLHLLLIGGLDWRGDEVGPVVAGALLLSIPLVSLFVAYISFLPAAVVVLAAELLGRRDWLFFTLSGGGVGLVVARFAPGREAGWTDSGLLWALVACGIAGGLAYWLVAGRGSGRWLHPDPSAPRRPAS